MTWHFMQTTACNRKKSLGLPFTIVTLLGTALPTSVIGHFRAPKKSHFQSEAKCEAIDMKMIFNCDANKTHFHNKVSHLASLWKWDVLDLGNGLLTSSTLNFVISDSDVQEKGHCPLGDIQRQSGRLGTEMLGTNACWHHMWPEWFAVPLKCLSMQAGSKKLLLASSVDGKELLFLSYRKTCENNSDYF